MKVFLTGATGYLGSAIARTLVRAGHRVRGLTRDPEKAEHLRKEGIEPALGDFENPMSVIIAAQESEALIHAGLSHGPNQSRNDRLAVQALLAAACRGRPKLFVYTSGTWILGPSKDDPVDEIAKLDPPGIVEWRPSMERLVLEASTAEMSAVVIRPGCVYGEKQGLFGRILHYLINERRVRLIEGGKNRWASVYIDDLAELYRLVIERRPRSGIFHASDGSTDTVNQIAEAFIDAAGGGVLENWPLPAARAELGPIADALVMDQLVSSRKARRELGWNPNVSSPASHARLLLEEWHETETPLTLV